MSSPKPNVMLFLGSGISYASGLPSVNKITQSVLEDDWFMHTDESICLGRCPGFKEEDLQESGRSLSLLQNFLKAFAAKNMFLDNFTVVNYEDIVARLLIISSKINNHDPRIDCTFVQTYLYDVAQSFIDKSPPLNIGKASDFIFRSQRFIEAVVRHQVSCLNTSAQLTGLNFFQTFAKSDILNLIGIATLNYDTLIEKTLEKSGIKYATGYSNSKIDEEQLLGGKVLPILKLHGSIDWKGFPLLLGSRMKEEFYTESNFIRLHYTFEKLLETTDLLVVSGYGWGDMVINKKLLNWLATEDKKMVIFHENPKENVSRFFRLSYKFEEYLAEHKIFPCEKHIGNCTDCEIESTIREAAKISFCPQASAPN